MRARSFLAVALGILCLAAPAALAAGTDLEKFEKKLARYAQRAAAGDYTKPRGLCVCQSDDAAIQGRTGVLVYGLEMGMVVDVMKAGCQVPFFDDAGVSSSGTLCTSWIPLSR